MRILIADDDRKQCEDLCHHLRMRFGPVECFFAETLEDAIRKRREIHALDAIVFDLSFKDTAAEDSVEAIHLFAPVPLFVLTGVADKGLFERAKEGGARACYIKGVDGSELIGRLGDLVHSRMPDPEKRKALAGHLFDLRNEQAQQQQQPSSAQPIEKRSWFSTTQAVITLGVVIVVQLVALFGFIWNQASANALFRRQVSENTNWISAAEPRLRTMETNDDRSVTDRANITKRLEAEAEKIEDNRKAQDVKTEQLRQEINAGFNRIYDLLLQRDKAGQPRN